MIKIAHFLVEKRIWLFCIFLLMAAGSIILIPKVKINTDMSLYLPDDSEMKQGKDIMEEQLPEVMKTKSRIRVMFDNLTDEESTYKGSIRTILTSGLIMVFVTWLLGYAFEEPAIGQICHILAIGTTSALVMILLILPGVLAACDRLVVKKSLLHLKES